MEMDETVIENQWKLVGCAGVDHSALQIYDTTAHQAIIKIIKIIQNIEFQNVEMD